MYFEFKNKEFFKKTFLLMLPVMLQNMITIGINFTDNIMIGSFGELQIDAVAFGNQFYGLFQFMCMGLGSGAVVMSSQFWGRKELGSMRIAAAIASRVTLILCAIFTVVTVGWPEMVLRIFTNDMAIINVGRTYIRLIGITFLLAGLTSTATYLLRSVGEVKVPLMGSGFAFLLNLFFNWVFIFGMFGAPKLEVVGAAVGTLIARTFEFCFIFGYFVLKDTRFGFRLRHFALNTSALRRQYIKYSIPVLISDTLLGLSLMLSSVIIGHVGAEMSAANSIVASLVRLINVLNIGMAGASAIVIGNTIGEGDQALAKRQANTYTIISFFFGLIMVIPLLAIRDVYFGIYNITDVTRDIAISMLMCNCMFLPVETVAYITSKGILRGGGDTRFLLLADSSLVWFVSLPLGFLAAFVWHMSAFWIFFFLRIEFPLKGIVCLIRYFSGKWIKVIKGAEK